MIKYLLILLSFIILAESFIVNVTITSGIYYETPFTDRNLQITISVAFDSFITYVYFQILSADDIELYNSGTIEGFSCVLSSSEFYSPTTNFLKGNLPFRMKLNPAANVTETFLNNTQPLEYYSQYYSREESIIEVSTVETLKPPPSGVSAACTYKRVIQIYKPNYYQYYYTDPYLLLTPVMRNDTFISFLYTFSTAASNVSPLEVLDLRPSTTLHNEMPLSCILPIYGITVGNSLDLLSFSTQIILMVGNSMVKTLLTKNFVDTEYTTIYSPSYLKISDAEYLIFFKIQRSDSNNSPQIVEIGAFTDNFDVSYINPSSPTFSSSKVSNFFVDTFNIDNSAVSVYPQGKEYSVSIRLTIEDYKLIDYINIYTLDGNPMSKPQVPMGEEASYYFILDSVPASCYIRLFYRYNKYQNIPLNLQSPVTTASVAEGESSITGSVYTVKITNLHPLEIPFLLSQFSLTNQAKTISTPIKTFTSEFPFKFTGYLNSSYYTPYIPMLNDTPNGAYLEIITKGTQNQQTSLLIPSKDDLKVDLVPPMANLTIVYNQMLPDGSKVDLLRVNVQDDIGIDNERCTLDYGPYRFKLDTSHRIKGGFNGDSTFLFALNLNRYFCDALISFACEDIRGNLAVWDSNTILEIIERFITIESKECSAGRVIDSIKLLSIDSTFPVGADTTVYSPQFAVTLQGIKSTSRFSVQLILENINGNEDENLSYLLSLPENQLESYSGTYTYYNSLSKTTLIKTTTYRYKLIIKDFKTLDELVLNHKEIQYISDTLSKDMRFNSNVTLLDPAFTGFSYVFTLSYSGTTLTVSSDQALLDVKYVNISLNNVISPYSKVYQYSVTAGTLVSSFSITSPIVCYSQFWVSGICDNNDNCQQYPSTFSNTRVSASIVTQPDFSVITCTTLFNYSKNDTSYSDRTFTFTFTMAYSDMDLQISPDHHPILYIEELDSTNRIKYQLTPTIAGHEYTVTSDFPLNWGARGIHKYYVYNILSSNGFFTGFDFAPVENLVINTSEPKIWSVTYYPSLSAILISGAYLGYLENDEFKPKLFSYMGSKIQTPLLLSYVNETHVYLSVTGLLSSNTILNIGQELFSFLVETCINPTCSGHGNCVGTTCECYSDWSGIDCSINTKYTCLNNCSGHGSCDFQICNCYPGFMGPSCDIIVGKNVPNVTVNTNTTSPTTSFNTDNEVSKQTNFIIMLSKMEEIDYQGTIIQSYDLLQENWNLTLSNSTSFLYEIPISNVTLITAIVTTTNDSPLSIQFANQSLQIPENSIKYYLKVDNYNFTSKANHLEFTWETYYKVPNPCSTKDQSVTYGGLDKSDIHYIIIPANQLQLYGRFSNLIVVDNRTLLSSNSAQELDDKVLIKVSVPYFDEYVELDPDFSVLVNLDESHDEDQEYDSECNPIESNSLPKYLIPVVVVSSVVSLALIVVSVVMLYKKNMTFKLSLLAVKNFFSKGSKSSSIRLSNIS